MRHLCVAWREELSPAISSRRVTVTTRTITANYLYAGVRRQPRGKRIGASIGKQVDNPAGLNVAQKSSISTSLAISWPGLEAAMPPICWRTVRFDSVVRAYGHPKSKPAPY